MTRWPAEWERHAATIVGWPWDASIWGEEFAAAEHAVAQIAAEISRSEDVYLLVDAAHQAVALDQISRCGPTDRVVPVGIVTDDVWVRDSGPTFVVSAGALSAVDWNFSAWGHKFPHSSDAEVARSLADRFRAAHVRADIRLEGGALEGNGSGMVLSTKSVAQNPNRNPSLSLEDAQDEILRRTGASQIVWLEGGMESDDTDGHIDTLARFVDPQTVVMQRLPPGDAMTEKANRDALKAAGLEIVELPRPGIESVPASYANFYWTNDAVLVPVFGVPADDDACQILSGCFERKLVPIDARALVSQGGAVHCLTQQVPAASGDHGRRTVELQRR